MAVRKYSTPPVEAGYVVGDSILTIYHADTYAERPVTGLNIGDLCFAVDLLLWYRAKDATTWEPITVGSSGSIDFRLENRTSDPASPAVGQMWLRTDL